MMDGFLWHFLKELLLGDYMIPKDNNCYNFLRENHQMMINKFLYYKQKNQQNSDYYFVYFIIIRKDWENGKRKYSLDCKEDNKVMAEDEIL